MSPAETYRINNLASLYALLRFVAPLFAGRRALADAQESRDYEVLLADVERLAVALARLGVTRGSRVALVASKSVSLVQTMLAVNACGATFIPVNPQLKPAQVEHIVRDSGASLFIASRFRLALLQGDVLGRAAPLALEELAAKAKALDATDVQRELRAATPSACDGDVGAVLYTSGSTGLPKGVVLTQRNLMSGALSIADYLGLTPDDVVLGVLPLSFDAGLSQLTTALAAGACYVPHEFINGAQLPKVCARFGITTMTAVPPLWHLVLEADWSEEGARLRRFANTGGHMNGELLARLRAAFPQARPFLMYGLTEAFRSTYLDPSQVDQRPGSIGKAVPNAEIAVVRPDGTECEAGEPGELVHRGAFVTLGYLNDDGRGKERFRPWPRRAAGVDRTELAVWSGDVVRRDQDGFLYFVGRNDEMIKTSGHRVSPTEIETVLGACPGVDGVAVVALPDERLGQRIVACVVAATDDVESHLTRHCRERLPNYLMPRHFLRFDSLQLNANGKIDRPRMRAACAERLETVSA
jgi:acyl-CoA ligase (AMP-forming) (exosortase A-associated)